MVAIPRLRRKPYLAMVGVFVVLSWVAGARAVTLDDYRHQVSRAHASIQELQAAYAAEYSSQREQFAAATIALVRAELPEQETVLLGRQAVAVANTWLHKALDQLEKIKGDNTRRDLLVHIDERLRALGERLDEMQDGKPGAGKDDNETRLAEILRRSEYNKQAEEGSALNRLLNRFLRWLNGL